MMAESQNCFAIQWSIENFSMCLQPCGEAMLSPHFREESSQNQVWYMKLYPGGFCDDSYIGIELCNTIEVCGVFNCTIAIVDKCGLRHFEKNDSNTYEDKCSIFRIPYFVEREELFDKKTSLLPRDTLTVQCVIRKPYLLHKIRQSLKLECLAFTWPITRFSWIRVGSGRLDEYGCPNDYDSHLVYPLTLNFADPPRLKMQFGVRKNSGGESKIFIKFNKLRKDGVTCIVYLSYEISAMHVSGSKIDLFRGQHIFDAHKVTDSHMTPVVLLEDRDSLILDDTLTLHVDLRFTDGSVQPEQTFRESQFQAIPRPKVASSAFSRNLNEKLYADQKFCDVVFRVGTESLSAHKSVLCTQSEVFGAMFDSDMVENGTGVVEITDIDAETMKRLLRLMYLGTVVEDLSYADASELYAAAHKYQVAFLDIVSSVLVSKIAVDNVWRVWSFAARYGDAALKAAAKSFVSQSMDDIAAVSPSSPSCTNEESDNDQRRLPQKHNIPKKLKRTSC